MIGLAFLAVAAVAEPGSVDFDIQCLVALQTAAGQMPEGGRMPMMVGTQFFFGRIDSVLSGKALEQRIVAVAAGMEHVPLQPLVQSCGAFMTERGEALSTVGRAVDARERPKATH